MSDIQDQAIQNVEAAIRLALRLGVPAGQIRTLAANVTAQEATS